MGPITGYEHDEYWREKAANKAADSHMMHVNLVKALRKVYSMQEYMQAYGYDCKVKDKEEKQGVEKWRHEKQWVLPESYGGWLIAWTWRMQRGTGMAVR